MLEGQVWRELRFKDTEFTVDYARKFEISYSAGLQLHNDQGILCGALIMTRSALQHGFSDREMSYLEMIKPHLDNLYTLMQKQTTHPQFSLTLLDGFNLTKRESEIAVLICQGLRTDEMSAKLFISKQTVYQHIKRIFEKLGVTSRAELIARVLGTKLIK